LEDNVLSINKTMMQKMGIWCRDVGKWESK
jgi:hypothetical protein